MTAIRFHFDYISPYAYLAWTKIHALADRNAVSVEPVPILFAALLNHHGQKGPAEIPAKRTYTFKDIVRRAHQHGVPIARPPAHPFNPLLALRATLAVPEEKRRAMVDGLYTATWGTGTGVEDPKSIAAVANAIGLDGEAIVARAGSGEIKDALKRATERAIAEGVFGVPTMQVGKEIFWGLESFDLLERHLAGNDPITPSLLGEFEGMKATASRQG
jgi:2-hydroxychromene-2-carboxylate isomerase